MWSFPVLSCHLRSKLLTTLKCGLPTYYEDEMPLLGAVDKPHWGQATIDVIVVLVCPGIFYFYFILFVFLIIMLSYIFLSCKPTTTTTRYYRYKLWMSCIGPNNDRYPGKFFFFFSFLTFFQLNWTNYNVFF